MASRWRVQTLPAAADCGPEYLVLEGAELRACAFDHESADRIAAALALLEEWARANGMSVEDLVRQERGKG